MGPFSENHTLHGGAERRSPAAVPKIIPMQAGRGLRGPQKSQGGPGCLVIEQWRRSVLHNLSLSREGDERPTAVSNIPLDRT